MSFGKKYFSSYKSNNGLDYYLELFVANFSGTATEIVLGKGGPVITYETDQEDRFSPILSSQCELPFLVQNTLHQDFIEELRTTFQERQIYLHLYRASSSTYSTTKPLWSGFMVMDLGAGEDVSFPYEQKLTFVDGLALLKDIDFVDLSNEDFADRVMGNYAQENMYFGPAIYTFWIREILAKTGAAISGVNGQGVTQDYGFTTAINWYNGAMPNTNQNFDPFGNTQCVVSMFHTKNDQQVFTPENCYTVLKELLRHWGARITYWKHEFWIVQIPEYIQDETGFIDNPDNINTRQYNRFGALQSSQDHLGDTFFTRYEQTVGPDQISKLVGTKYNYLPITHRASADFLSFASKNYYGGFPFGNDATSQEIFQGTIIDPSSANFLFLSIPLNWVWDLSNSNIVQHTGGWWCSIKFNFYATDGTTEYYLQYEQTTGTYYWVLKADWSPIVKSPKYVIKSRRNIETNYIGFQEQIPFVDANGNAITMNGAWSFFLDIEDYATQNGGSFFCRFSEYNNFTGTVVQRNPLVSILLPDPLSSGTTPSGTVSWSNTLQDPTQILVPSTNVPVTFDAGTPQPDIQLLTNSAFMGFLQTLNTTQNASYGNQVVTTINNSNNTEIHDFGTLIWGDAVLQATIGALRVNNGSTFVKTNPDGEWGRGTLSGTKTFTELLIDEFLSGQVKVVISPTMRLVVSEALKNQTSTASGGGTAERPRYVNPIGRLRETRSNETDPEYFFRRGSFFTLQDEWDYEGYQIIRDTVTATTTTNDLGGLGGSQTDAPLANARMQGPVTNALMQNAPVAYLRKTVASTGSNVSVNGNFNTATGWTLGTGWSIDTTISKAKFTATGSTSDLVQDVLELEKTYKISFRVEVTAGTLTVKAGTSGGTEVVTTSGDYIIYKQCLGNTQIKFQAGTTFTGTVTFVRIEEQKSLSQVPIEPLDSAVFKSGDTFNLINSNSGEIMELNVTSNQSAGDTVINVTSTALFDDINIGSIVLINQDDLAAQYQNKTKGTVGGFDITATSIDSGSVAISSYIDDDTFATASATSLATSESIKAYVDTQVGSADTLQEVTDNGNTTTNAITIGSSSSPSYALDVYGDVQFRDTSENVRLYLTSNNAYNSIIYLGDNNNGTIGRIQYVNANNSLGFYTNASEKARITSDGQFGLGTSSPSEILNLAGNNPNIRIDDTSAASRSELNSDISWYDSTGAQGGFIGYFQSANLEIRSTAGDVSIGTFAGTQIYIDGSNTGIGTLTPSEKLDVVGNVKIRGTNNLTIGSTSDGGDFSLSSGIRGYKFANNNGELLRITSDGHLGLGTSSPTTKMEIAGTGNQKFLVNRTDGDSFFIDAQNGQIRLRGTDNIIMGVGADVLTITNTSVGIGVTSPAQLLHVYGSSNATAQVQGNSGLATMRLISGSYTTGYDMLLDTGGTAYLFNRNNGNLSFGTNNSEKMRLTSDGKVGIGTTSPEEILHIQETDNDARIQIITSNTRSSTIFFGDTDDDNAGIIEYDNNGDFMRFFANASEAMRITSDGDLSIGTTSSDARLHLFDDNCVIKLESSFGRFSTITQGGGHLHINTNHANGLALNFGNTTHKGFLALYDNETSAVQLKADGVTFFNGGNVGIGTDSPARTLDVNGDLGLATSVNAIRINGVGVFGVLNGMTRIVGQGSGGNNGIVFTPNNDNTEKMRLTSTGRLGIGLTNPSTDLHIKSTSAGSGYVTIENTVHFSKLDLKSSSFTGSIIMDGTGGYIGSGGFLFDSGTNPRTRFLQGGVDKMSIVNGNVGIGTSSPTRPLHVKNTSSQTVAIFDGGNNSAGEIAFSGSGTSGGTYVTIGAIGNDMSLSAGANERMRITSSGNVLINTTTDDGSSKLQVNGNVKLNDNFLYIGTGNDFYIRHDGSNTTMYNSTGHFGIYNAADGKDITFYCDDGSGGVTEYFNIDGGAVRNIFSKDVSLGDNVKLIIGSSSDLQIFHDSNNTLIENYVGNITFEQRADDKDIIFKCDNGSGGTTAYITLDGSATRTNVHKFMRFLDNVKAEFGSGDLGIFHDGNNSTIQQAGTGNLIIRQDTEDADILFRCDDGTGGIADYLKLDGSQTTVNVSQNLLLNTTTDSGGSMTISGNIDFIGSSDKIHFKGSSGGNNEGILYKDSGGSQRYGLLFAGSDVVALANRAANGTVQIRANTSTAGTGGEVTVAEFENSLIKLNKPVQVSRSTAPSDPPANTGVIYLDSNFDLKIKINGSEGVVTRTLAQYES